jgi:hypothetical protein
MNCNFCKNTFTNKNTLKTHMKTAKYCLKIQNIDKKYFKKCNGCGKSFSTKFNFQRHIQLCTQIEYFQQFSVRINKLEKKVSDLSNMNDILDNQLEESKQTIRDLQDKLENIALKAVSTSSTTNNNTMTKNIQINNFLKNAPALTDQVIQDNIQYLTLDHHVQGAEGYAKYAMEFPFKGRIVCVDVARNKIKYKDGDGNVIEDAGFQKMMMKLCKAIYGKSYDLSIEHLDKLAKQFTEKELEQYDYLEAAKAITMYSKGSESDFCRKIIKIISKSVGGAAASGAASVVVG